MIEVLDLFSAAAGGWSLGMHRAGYTTLAACEVEAWRRALYSENNPNVKVYDDVRTLTADRLLADLGRLPSVVVGSPPCQDISSANTKGKGVEGERSGLYFEAVRIIGECRPRWFALENSANLRTRGADAVITALEAIGYARLPGLREAGFGGSYAALLGHRNRKAAPDLLRVPKLVGLYQQSPAYRALAASSQKLYDIYLRRLEKLLPTAPIAEITRGDMRKLIDGMSTTPGAANAFLSTSSALFGWAKDREYLQTNPCDGIDAMAQGEHQPWPEHVLRAALEADDGTVRLLTNLLYYTAQRLGDVLAMTWEDITDERMLVRQKKTGKVLSIPLHRDLRAELSGRERGGAVICTAVSGRAISGDMARKSLKEFTALQNATCVPHGLRKNAVIALLEAGCSVAETSAISGQSLAMVEHYARRRDQAKLAGDAMLRWERDTDVAIAN